VAPARRLWPAPAGGTVGGQLAPAVRLGPDRPRQAAARSVLAGTLGAAGSNLAMLSFFSFFFKICIYDWDLFVNESFLVVIYFLKIYL
jgi:hypothetical protein